MIYVLNYAGISFISKAIKTVTWSDFSHTALCKESGLTLEAWHLGGVDLAATPWVNHKAGTLITVYGLKLDPILARKVWQEAANLVGCKYDFRAISGFLPGMRRFWADHEDKWFCSHLVAAAFSRASVPLFSKQTKLYKISPALIDTSIELVQLGVVRNMDGFKGLVQ